MFGYILGFRTDLKLLSMDDVERLFVWLKNSDFQYATKYDYWMMFKVITKFLNPAIDCKGFKLVSKKLKKLPEDILSEDEVTLMIKSATSIRNRALISVLYETGCRIGELVGIKIKDVVFDEYGAVIIVDGKTGMRRIRIINSVPLLSQYLQEHRFRDDITAPLFYRYDKHYRTKLSEAGISKQLKETARLIGIKKRVYAHLFRHSRATHLAKYLTEQELKVYFGWVGDSKMACVYVHLSGKDIENKILEINGIIAPKTTANGHSKPKQCPRCKIMNDYTSKFCSSCSQVLDIKEATGLDIKPSEFEEFMQFYKKWKETK